MSNREYIEAMSGLEDLLDEDDVELASNELVPDKSTTDQQQDQQQQSSRVTIQIRCSREERDRWQWLASQCGHTISSWVRYVLNQAYRLHHERIDLELQEYFGKTVDTIEGSREEDRDVAD